LFGLLQDYLLSLQRRESPSPASVEAWEEFYRLCSSIITSTFKLRDRREVDLGDYAQEIWMILIERLGRMRYDAKRGRLEGLIRSSIRHAFIDLLRRQARKSMQALPVAWEERVEGRDDDPKEILLRKELKMIVDDVLKKMSDRVPLRDFRVFWLRNIAEKGVQEIAEELGMSPEQVRIQDHRTRKKFLHYLRNLYDLPQ
jgi:RNA polymerase sigma factor (sigma-70 family)